MSEDQSFLKSHLRKKKLNQQTTLLAYISRQHMQLKSIS